MPFGADAMPGVAPHPGVARQRVLVAILVYNGRAFVPRGLASAAQLRLTSRHDVDVLVLDDASPDVGWSEELREICERLGLGYYGTPRNLGIPRNMNLGLLRAEAAGYDHVVILNSDVVLPANMIDGLLAVAATDPKIASVTAWSNNASIFSLPNDEADRFLADAPTVDAVSMVLQDEFGDQAVDVPVGVGFCMCISKEAIAEVGLFDPVFGRGYCEEVDWCRRAVSLGWRNVLAPSVFVYHIGSASTRLAGLLAPGEQTVHTHEEIVDQRHPDYRGDVEGWRARGGVDAIVERGLRRLVATAAAERGYVLDATWLRREPEDHSDDRVRITINPDGPSPLVEATANGWRCALPVGPDGILAAVGSFVGCPPSQVRILDRGSVAAALEVDALAAGVPVRALRRYPERV